jgi:hypothetical protein
VVGTMIPILKTQNGDPQFGTLWTCVVPSEMSARL